jgi:hypothetical protein
MLVENIKVREARPIKLIEEMHQKIKMNGLTCLFFIGISTVTLSQ